MDDTRTNAEAPLDRLLVPAWPDGARMIGAGRSKMFELIAAGEIESVSLGRKRMVPVEALRDFVDRLRAEQRPQAVA